MEDYGGLSFLSIIIFNDMEVNAVTIIIDKHFIYSELITTDR